MEAITHPDEAKPIQRLYCTCCGGVTRGRQWFNMDTGFSLCVDCAPRCLESERKDREQGDCGQQPRYGIRGIHYDIAEPQEDPERWDGMS